ncbi:MAG TPA: hypothetical protein VEQ87_02980 [Burkholderiales bacterium]|nr:hypothetical protein [Burkholderiales bacterium]
MGKIGRTYIRPARAAHTNSVAALARFDRPLTPDEGLMMRHEITSGVVGLFCFLAFVAWVLAN